MRNIILLSTLILTFSACKKDLVDTTLNDIKDVTSLSEFQSDISSGVSLVFFHASWCHICEEQRPAVEETATNPDLSNVMFFEVEYDDNKDVTNEYNVPGFPQILLFKDGVEQKRYTGKGHTAETLANALKALL